LARRYSSKITGDRFPCGRLRPDKFPPVLVRQMLDAAKDRLIDHRIGTQIGRLRLEGVLSDAHVAAADKFALVINKHEKTAGLPRRTASSLDLAGAQVRSTSDAPDADDAARWQRERDLIQAALSPDESRIAFDVVTLNLAPTYSEKPVLARALQKLAVLFHYAAAQSAVKPRSIP
jgi:hypothetical protein